MENYLYINGKKIELTEEQVKKSTETEPEKKKNPFERVGHGEKYYIVEANGELDCLCDTDDGYDCDYFEVANYCTDEELMQQRALHETLDRLLWRFSCENGELENEWEPGNSHWKIYYDTVNAILCIAIAELHKCGDIYFSSPEIAQRAIDEIIKPFMAEHPEFVW